MRRIWPRRKGEIFKVKVPLSSINHLKPSSYCMYLQICGPGSLVGIATDYGLDGPGIESQWGRDFPPRSDRPWGPPSLVYNGYRVFPRGKERPGRDADPLLPSSAVVMKEYSYTSTPPMGCTACTEPQCLYTGCTLPFFFFTILII